MSPLSVKGAPPLGGRRRSVIWVWMLLPPMTSFLPEKVVLQGTTISPLLENISDMDISILTSVPAMFMQ